MLFSMRLFFDSLWRAVAYCFMPRIMALALLPQVMLLVLALSWGYFYWQPTQDLVSEFLMSWQVMQSMMDWMQAHGAGDLQGVLVPLVVIFSITPILVVMSLLAVSLMMGPALVSLVVKRRFAHLAMKHGGTVFNSIVWTLVSTISAMLAMLISLPLWVVPPLMFIVPPIIWGWLSYRVMVFDALVAHASRDERIAIYEALCDQLNAAPVQHIGKLLVLWKPKENIEDTSSHLGRSSKQSKKSMQTPSSKKSVQRSANSKSPFARAAAVKTAIGKKRILRANATESKIGWTSPGYKKATATPSPIKKRKVRMSSTKKKSLGI